MPDVAENAVVPVTMPVCFCGEFGALFMFGSTIPYLSSQDRYPLLFTEHDNVTVTNPFPLLVLCMSIKRGRSG